MSAEKTT